MKDLQIASRVKRLLRYQLCAGVLLAAGMMFWNPVAAHSLVIGAAIAFLPNVYYALRVFDMSKARCVDSTLRALYAGAMGKMIMTATLFCVAFLLLAPLHIPALFLGFIAVQLMHFLVLPG